MPGGFNFGGSSSSDDSTNSALISYELAELNSLNVGDTIKLKNIYTEKSIKLTVIGIYDGSEARTDSGTIYMNTDTAAKFLNTDDYNDGNYDVDNVNYYMVIVIEKGPGAIARATGILCSRMQDVFS